MKHMYTRFDTPIEDIQKLYGYSPARATEIHILGIKALKKHDEALDFLNEKVLAGKWNVKSLARKEYLTKMKEANDLKELYFGYLLPTNSNR